MWMLFYFLLPTIKFNLHKWATACSCQIEHREGVNDETQLLVRQQWIDEDKAHCGEQQQSYSLVKEAKGYEEQRAAQGTGYGGVKIP